jgi:hypothetical protein
MSVEVKGEPNDGALGVDPVNDHLRGACAYRCQSAAISHLKSKFHLGFGELHTGRLRVCIPTNGNTRAKVNAQAIIDFVHVALVPRFQQVCPLQKIPQVTQIAVVRHGT